MSGVNKTNEYSRDFPNYERTPKSVIAAIAYSFALNLCEDDLEAADRFILKEWEILHDAGIVPQKPVKKALS